MSLSGSESGSDDRVPRGTDRSRRRRMLRRGLVEGEQAEIDADNPARKAAALRVKRREMVRERREEAPRTVFVGNWPVRLGAAGLRSHFKKVGAVETTWLRGLAFDLESKKPRRVQAILGTYNADIKPGCCGFVRFEDEESVAKALALSATIVEGHHIVVDRTDVPTPFEPHNSVFVGSLPFSVQEDGLWEHFEGCGPVTGVRVVRDSVSQIGKGIAFVRFANASDVKTALALDKSDFGGRMMRVSRVEKKPDGPGAKPAGHPGGGSGGGGGGETKKKTPAISMTTLVSKPFVAAQVGPKEAAATPGKNKRKWERMEREIAEAEVATEGSEAPKEKKPKKPKHENSARKQRRREEALQREQEKAAAGEGSKGGKGGNGGGGGGGEKAKPTPAPAPKPSAPSTVVPNFAGTISSRSEIPKIGAPIKKFKKAEKKDHKAIKAKEKKKDEKRLLKRANRNKKDE